MLRLFYIFASNMSKLKEIYEESKNGIIVTLIFHIIVFVVLNIGQFRIKREFVEPEIIIDFPFEPITPPDINKQTLNDQAQNQNNKRSNIASNRAATEKNNEMDEALRQELERARELVENVSQQLSKEIPTIKDLQMPEELTDGLDPDSIMKKLYTGDSNVEYFLENRYHTRLPIPVYLSQYGGTVTVNILVDKNGNVISAEPQVSGNESEQLLSYAKTAALRTKFNPQTKAPARQAGHIKYHFVSQ